MGKRRIDLSGTKVAANVLATVTGATAASYFGVAGTITGTVVMSVASSAGTTVYQHYLNRGGATVRKITPAVVPRPRVSRSSPVPGWDAGADHGATVPAAGGAYRDGRNAVAAGARHSGASGRAGDGDPQATRQLENTFPAVPGGFPPAAGGFPTVSGGIPAVPAGHGASGRKRPDWGQIFRKDVDWKRIAIAAAATLVLAIVVISVIELAAGRPLGAIVGGQRASGTSIGNVLGSHPGPARSQSPSGPGSSAPAQAPAPANTAGPAPARSQLPTPAPSPAPTAPASSPAGGGSNGNGASPAAPGIQQTQP